MQISSFTRPFRVKATPVSANCNLNCSYCYYSEKKMLYPHATIMYASTLKTFIASYINANRPESEVVFIWQGGEPTLAGLDFYQKVVELQRQLACGRRIENHIHTNGLLLNDKWCRFFVDNNFLVMLSLDGPDDLHDILRTSPSGSPTHHRVMQTLRQLQDYGVHYQIVVSVNRYNARQPEQVYDFLYENGVRNIQFVPVVERRANPGEILQGQRLHAPGASASQIMPWSVLPESYGYFLISIFKRWVKRDVDTVLITNISDAFASIMNRTGEICHHHPTCGRTVALEYNGDLYACDRYVYASYFRGNITERDLSTTVDDAEQKTFGSDKLKRLTHQCRRCEVLKMCWGGCLKHRFATTWEQEYGLNYLCQGYRLFFTYIQPYLEEMSKLIARARPVSDIMTTEFTPRKR